MPLSEIILNSYPRFNIDVLEVIPVKAPVAGQAELHGQQLGPLKAAVLQQVLSGADGLPLAWNKRSRCFPSSGFMRRNLFKAMLST